MRRMMTLAGVLAVALVAPGVASAFETDDPAPTALSLNSDTTHFSDPMEAKVLPEINLEAFGGSIGNLRPNYIPGPEQETPNWYYSTPSFRATR
jgi:hypothetical protein